MSLRGTSLLLATWQVRFPLTAKQQTQPVTEGIQTGCFCTCTSVNDVAERQRPATCALKPSAVRLACKLLSAKIFLLLLLLLLLFHFDVLPLPCAADSPALPPGVWVTQNMAAPGLQGQCHQVKGTL
jgi:hypothetical protein